MSKAFDNMINVKSDNPIYNRMMTNYNETPSYEQFDSNTFNSNQLTDSLQLLSATDNLIIEPVSNINHE